MGFELGAVGHVNHVGGDIVDGGRPVVRRRSAQRAVLASGPRLPVTLASAEAKASDGPCDFSLPNSFSKMVGFSDAATAAARRSWRPASSRGPVRARSAAIGARRTLRRHCAPDGAAGGTLAPASFRPSTASAAPEGSHLAVPPRRTGHQTKARGRRQIDRCGTQRRRYRERGKNLVEGRCAPRSRCRRPLDDATSKSSPARLDKRWRRKHWHRPSSRTPARLRRRRRRRKHGKGLAFRDEFLWLYAAKS